MKKMFKAMLAFAVALVPVIGVATAFADEETVRLVPETITKYLETPCDATFPDGATFTFEFDLIGEIVGTDPGRIAAPVPGPSIPDRTVTFDAEDLYVVSEEDGICVFSEEVNFTADVDWLRPGHFIFLVTETEDTNTLPFMEGYDEEMRYDRTEFELHVIVSERGGNLVVTGTFAWDLGEVEDGWAGIPAIPGEDLTNQTGKVDYISFTNTFIRRTEPTDDCPPEHPLYPECDFIPDPVCPEEDPDYPYCEPEVPVFDSALTISKLVSGDQADTTIYFDFNFHIAAHALEEEGRTFYAYLWTHDLDEGGWVRGERVGFEAGDNTFELRHGQALVFDPIVIGTNVQVIEIDYAPYTPSVTVTSGGAASSLNSPNTGRFPILEGNNSAAFLNVLNSVPITGLIAENLPFILVGVAAVGFFMMVVVGKKRRAYE